MMPSTPRQGERERERERGREGEERERQKKRTHPRTCGLGLINKNDYGIFMTGSLFLYVIDG